MQDETGGSVCGPSVNLVKRVQESGLAVSIRVRLKAPGIEALSATREMVLRDDISLHELMVQLEMEFGRVVNDGFAAVNSEVIRRDQLSQVRLKDGDEVLLIPPLALG